MDAFIAAPKTYIVERMSRDDSRYTTRIPVVGWVYVQGTLAYPIAPLAFGGLTDKRAVLMPDGSVCDRYFDAVFADLSAWEAAVDEMGDEIDRSNPTGPDNVLAERVPAAQEARQQAANQQPARRPKKERRLQQKSFWGKKDQKVILIVEGGVVLPDERDWTKITRDEYDTRKRDGYAVWKSESGPEPDPVEEANAAQDRPHDHAGFDNSDLI